MEATFIMKPEELTPEWLEELKNQFAEDGTITITASGLEKNISSDGQRMRAQREVLKRMRALRERTASVPVTLSRGVDINDIIDDVNDVSL